MSDIEFLTEPFEEEGKRTETSYAHPAVRSFMYTHMSGDSDSDDEGTLKRSEWQKATPASQSSSETTSTDDSDVSDVEPPAATACSSGNEYRALTPSSRTADISTRCNTDFHWLRSGESLEKTDFVQMRSSCERASIPEMDETSYVSVGSLDRRRRRIGYGNDRQERDRKSKSSMHSNKPPAHPSSARASPRRSRPSHTPNDSINDLHRGWNSYEHFRYLPDGGWWPPPPCWCHGPPVPSCCSRDHTSHWIPPPPPHHPPPRKNDAEERVHRLESDKESLQLQVQVLSEQVAAQSEKIADLERALSDKKLLLDEADAKLQKEMVARSSLETQKLELLSALSEVRLRAAERGVRDRASPPAPPRTPPANYGRQIERNSLAYSSLPRAPASLYNTGSKLNEKVTVVARSRGYSVPNLAENQLTPASGGGVRLEGTELARGGLRATAMPRMQTVSAANKWQDVDVKDWDAEITCSWLESVGLGTYTTAARNWFLQNPDNKGLLASATGNALEKELGLKHPLHKKKILLAMVDMQGGDGDPLLNAAGSLDWRWTSRWLEDAGASPPTRDAATAAALDGRLLHRMTHTELYRHLHVNTAIHALSIKRGIQVLRENNFRPDTMIRRALERENTSETERGELQISEAERELVSRWSSHRVMQWLNEIDLAEYAPNLRGAGVHGGLMLYEPRFTAELLATLLNIPATKTLLRRHLTQRFNDLLGRDVIQQKRTAEQTLGYQPLTITTKYKIPKKSFTLKKKKFVRDELDITELVCPLNNDDDNSGLFDDDDVKNTSKGRVGCLSPA